jgi:enoyl-CoA hydratase/carnithine racemase
MEIMSSTSESALADEPEVLVEVDDGIGRITLNRPAERNPIGVNLAAEMTAALDRLEADMDCRAIILTGNGPVFCGGADLKRILSATGDIDMEWQLQLIRGFNRVIQRMRSHDLPIIAAVNGPAVGGGAALAMACDIAIASDKASYYFAFGRIGAAGTDMGCTYLLPRLVGQMRAAHLILTGATVTAGEGRDLGLFTDVVAADELRPAAETIARQIAEAYPRRAAATTKLGLVRGENMPLEACLDYEAIAQNYNFRGAEHRERLGAFLGAKG